MQSIQASIDVEEITSAERLGVLRDEWDRLVDRSRLATPFQRPEWLLPWAARFAPPSIWALALRAHGRLVGLAPMFLYSSDRARIAAPLGAGISDYLEMPLDSDLEDQTAAALLAHLARRSDRWDYCDFEELRAGSPLLRAPLPEGLSDERAEQSACPVLRLPPAVDQLREVVPRHLLRNLRTARNRAVREGHLRVDVADASSLDEVLDALLTLHRARWTTRGSSGVLDSSTLQAFHREVAAAFLARGALRLYAARLDHRIIAALYGFSDHRRTYFYIHGLDPRFERLSPGALVIGHALEEAVRSGAQEWDFLRGREPYKYAWGAGDEITYRRRLKHTATLRGGPAP